MIVDAGVTSWNENPSEVGLHLNTGVWGQGSHTIDKSRAGKSIRGIPPSPFIMQMTKVRPNEIKRLSQVSNKEH